MISLNAKIREISGKKVKKLREKGIVPAILYGPKIKNISLEVDSKAFDKVYREAGTSSLISLEVDKKKFMVLIHAVELDALSQRPVHVDFYQPRLDEEITANIPLVFEGEAPAVKELNGTFIRNIHEIEVRALPQNLPHEIKVNIDKLKTFEDNILVKDLIIPKEVRILKDPEETVAFVAEPEKIEEELEKPIEEKVEEVEKVGEKKEEGKEEEEEVPSPSVKEDKKDKGGENE